MLVLDASVIVKLFLNEGESSLKAKSILDSHLAGNETIAAPELLSYEIGNTLACKKQLTEEVALKSLMHLFSFELNITPMDHEDHLRMLQTARHFGISIYDGAYIHLAQKLSCPLITADEKLYEKTKSLPFVKLLH